MTTNGSWWKDSPFSLRAWPPVGGSFPSGWFPTHEYLDNNLKLESIGVDLEVVKGRSEDEQDQNNLYAHVNLSRNKIIF